MPETPPPPAYVLRGHNIGVQTILFHSTKQLLYSGDAQGLLIVWDLQDRRPISENWLHTPDAGIICLLQLESTLLSQGRDGLILLWSLDSSGLPSRTANSQFQGGYTFCKAASISLFNVTTSTVRDSEGKIFEAEHAWQCSHAIAFPGLDASSVVVCQPQGTGGQTTLRQPETVMKCGMCMTISLYVSRDQQQLAILRAVVGYEDGTVAVWSLTSPAAPISFGRLQQEPIMALVLNADGSGGICGSADTNLVEFSIDATGKQLAVQHCISMQTAGTGDIAVRQDARMFAVAGWNGSVIIFHRHKRRILAKLQYHKGGATTVAFQPGTGMIASGSRDGTVATWLVFADVPSAYRS